MRIAIFGANGYLGRHLVHSLSSQGCAITGFGRQPAYAGREDIAYVRIDVSDRSQFDQCADFDQVYFFSGLSGTAVSFRNYADFMRVNELGLLNLLDRYKDAPRKPRIVFPSTRLVYKGAQGLPIPETGDKECKTVYASSKHSGELYLAMYRNMFGFDYTVYRICVPYGQVVGSRPSYGTVGFFLERAIAGRPIELYGDGSLKRTFSHVLDVCRQVVETSSLPQTRGECFNVDGETFSLAEVAGLIAQKFGVEVRFKEWPESDLRLESGDTIFDASRIRALLKPTLTRSVRTWISDPQA